MDQSYILFYFISFYRIMNTVGDAAGGQIHHLLPFMNGQVGVWLPLLPRHL